MANLNFSEQKIKDRDDKIEEITEELDNFNEDPLLENNEISTVLVAIFTIVPIIILIVLFI